MIVKTTLWRWTLFLVALTSGAVVICALLYLTLQKQVDANKYLIMRLQAKDGQLAASQAEALRREQALQLVVRGLQGQVRQLGGTPLQLPPALQKPPSYSGSTPSAPGSPTPRPSAAPAPRPRPSSPPQTPRPSPSSSPRPTSTPSPAPSCLVKVGTVCVRPL